MLLLLLFFVVLYGVVGVVGVDCVVGMCVSCAGGVVGSCGICIAVVNCVVADVDDVAVGDTIIRCDVDVVVLLVLLDRIIFVCSVAGATPVNVVVVVAICVDVVVT